METPTNDPITEQIQAQPTKLKLTRAQATAVRATIQEINTLTGVLQAKHNEFKRLSDMLQTDAEIDPEMYLIEGVEDVKGETYMKLVPKPPEGK